MKKAFVFDTNFIIENLDLEKVVENLKDSYVVYVTQVSIDERKAQQCREIKKNFDKIEEIKEKHSDIANVSLRTTFEKTEEKYHTGIQKRYKELFSNNIIPYMDKQKMFDDVMERANKKIAPFLSNTAASDKGFKDCVLWLCLIEFFKTHGEDELIFLTNDKSAFLNNSEFLTNEFNEKTGKKITFKQNSYYGELVKQKDKNEDKPEEVRVPQLLIDTAEYRNKIYSELESICSVELTDVWGYYAKVKTFLLNKKVTVTDVEQFFGLLKTELDKNMFRKSVLATEVFMWGDIISDGEAHISMSNLERAYNLYQEISNNCPQYLTQFYIAAADIFNENYKKPELYVIDDNQVPF